MDMTKQIILGKGNRLRLILLHGICLLEFINGQIHLKFTEEYDQVRYEDAVSKIKSILQS